MASLGRSLLFAAIAFSILSLRACNAAKYRDVLDVIEKWQETLSKHPFFAYLADESISPKRRLQFMPYWTYFAVNGADILDNWIRIENPTSELEERVNTFVNEDSFHYNFFLHDLEKVLGYTLDRYGSFEAVVRHIWSDETRTVRQYSTEWAFQVSKYNDPVVTLATFEATEAGLTDLFEVAFAHVYLPDNGLKQVKYVGPEHVSLEANHTVTGWFSDEDAPVRPLDDLEITEEQKENCFAATKALMDR